MKSNIGSLNTLIDKSLERLFREIKEREQDAITDSADISR